MNRPLFADKIGNHKKRDRVGTESRRLKKIVNNLRLHFGGRGAISMARDEQLASKYRR